MQAIFAQELTAFFTKADNTNTSCLNVLYLIRLQKNLLKNLR